ncbi:MAG: hypothetical protein LBE62_04820 [Azonexus sp.]|jgi:hypothetical protein|nr:hypothetical protein [Azonexus sp.]
MSRRRWAAPLFALALAVFWACLALPGLLYPANEENRSHYALSSEEAAQLRNIVIEAAQPSWHEVDLIWSAEPLLELTSDEASATRLVLMREGDTLYIRDNPEARDKLRIKTLRLPLTVERVQGDALKLSGGLAPARLELTARRVEIGGCNDCPALAEIQHLRVVGLASGCYAWSATLDIDATHIGALELETVGDKVALSHISHLPRVPLQGAPELRLEIGQATDLPRIAWSALPAERAQALKDMAPCRNGDEYENERVIKRKVCP